MSDAVTVAIDGGGTGTRAGLYDGGANLLAETFGSASNPAQFGIDRCVSTLEWLTKQLLHQRDASAVVLAVGLSGARDTETRNRIARMVCARLGVRRVYLTTDVHAQLYANAKGRPAALVVAGTGSSIAMINRRKETVLVGGRGPILGDEGSAYHIVTYALRAACHSWDEHGSMPALMTALAKAAELNAPEELIPWSVRASKNAIAALAPAVLGLAESELPVRRVVEPCAAALARVVQQGIHRASLESETPIYLAGGVFECSALYRAMFTNALKGARLPNRCEVAPLRGHRAVLALAQSQDWPDAFPISVASEATSKTAALASTEMRVDDGIALDALSAHEMVERMNGHNALAATSVANASEAIAEVIERVARAFQSGGRLIYAGAGTSGRLGVLDASECPPTFGAPPSQVLALIAGGERALRHSVEDAEDDEGLGRDEIDIINPPVNANDVVIGIAASGTTPFTLGAIAAAKLRGATTAMVYCNPSAQPNVDVRIALATGAEPLPGSTRLTAGTATKMALNMITTCAMALSGRVFEGWMIGVVPSNAKLLKRAARIIAALTGLDESAAAARLAEAGNVVAVAVLMERLHISADAAHALLAQANGNVRKAVALHGHGNAK